MECRGHCIIREARPGDAEDILRIYYENSMELLGLETIDDMLRYDREMYGEEYKFLSRRNLEEYIGRSSGSVLVAETETGIGGFTVYYMMPSSGTGYIEEIHVARGYRGRGIGASLLHAAEERLWSIGAAVIFLEANTHYYGFFHHMGYDPVNIEETPYMGKLWYIDMVKTRSGRRYVAEAARLFRQGNYHEALTKIEEALELLEPRKLPHNFATLLWLLARIHLDDEETQSYMPLYHRIGDVYIKKASQLYRDILLLQQERILFEGLHATSLYTLMYRRLPVVYDILERLFNWLRKTGIKELPVVNFLYDYAASQLLWFNASALTAKAVLGKLPLRAVGMKGVEKLLLQWRGGWPFNEFHTEAMDIMASLSSFMASKGYVYHGVLDALITHYNYIIIHGFEKAVERNGVRGFAEKLAGYIRDKTGVEARISPGKIISEDMIPSALRGVYRGAYTIMVDKVFAENPVEPGLRREYFLRIEVFGNGIIALRLHTVLSGASTAEIYEAVRAAASSVIEYNVGIGDYIISAKDLGDVRGDYSSLWYMMYILIRDFYRELTGDGGGVVMENEPLLHSIVEIAGSGAENDASMDILGDIYVKFLATGSQTAFTTPLAAAAIPLPLRDKGLAEIIGFPGDIIYVTPSLTLIYASSMPLWIRRELSTLIEMLSLSRAVLYSNYLRLRRAVASLAEKEISHDRLSRAVECIRKIHRDIFSYMHFINSPMPTRYAEYNEFIARAKEIMGIGSIQRLIGSEYDELLRLLNLVMASEQAVETKYLREFIEREESERRVLEYLAVLVGMAGLGEIFYNILSATTKPTPILRAASYLSGIILSLLLLWFISKRHSIRTI